MSEVERVRGYAFNLHPELQSDAEWVSAEDYDDADRRAQESEAWARFLENWVDYNHGKGESDRAWEEFKCHE